MSKEVKAFAPIISMVKPLAKKHVTPETMGSLFDVNFSIMPVSCVTPENMSALFDALTAQFPTEPGEKNVLLINRAPDGVVMGGVWSVDTATRTLTGAYVQMPLDQLILELLGKL